MAKQDVPFAYAPFFAAPTQPVTGKYVAYYAGRPYNTPQRYARLAPKHAGLADLLGCHATQRMDQRIDALDPPIDRM